MTAILKLEVNEVKNLINQFSDEEKIELAKYIDQITLSKRFKQFLKANQGNALTLEDITKEVEAVRKERKK